MVPAVRTLLLQEAKGAIDDMDTTKRTATANAFLDNFANMPFFRAVAKILLAHDGSVLRRNMCKENNFEAEEQEALKNNTDVNPEATKERVRIRENRIDEIEAEDNAAHQAQVALARQQRANMTQDELQAEIDAAAEAEAEQLRAMERYARAEAEADEREAREEGADDAEIEARRKAAVKKDVEYIKNKDARLAGEEKQRKAAKAAADAEVLKQQAVQQQGD